MQRVCGPAVPRGWPLAVSDLVCVVEVGVPARLAVLVEVLCSTWG